MLNLKKKSPSCRILRLSVIEKMPKIYSSSPLKQDFSHPKPFISFSVFEGKQSSYHQNQVHDRHVDFDKHLPFQSSDYIEAEFGINVLDHGLILTFLHVAGGCLYQSFLLRTSLEN